MLDVILSEVEQTSKFKSVPVLEAMHIAPDVGMGAVRFSLGRTTTRNEINVVVERLTDLFAKAG